MNALKNIILSVICFFSVCFLNALPKIEVKTDNALISCKMQPYTRAEAQEIFGSTGPLNAAPTDHIIKYYRNGAYAGQKIENSFSNLHGRFFCVEVRIENNSNKSIKIPNFILNSWRRKSYLSVFNKDMFCEQKEICDRYATFDLSQKLVMYGTCLGTSIFSLIVGAAMKNNPNLKNELFLPTLASTGLSLWTGYETFCDLKKRSLKKNLEKQFCCIDGIRLDEETLNEKFISIAPQAVFTDLMFINRASFPKIDDEIFSSSCMPMLFYEVSE